MVVGGYEVAAAEELLLTRTKQVVEPNGGNIDLDRLVSLFASELSGPSEVP